MRKLISLAVACVFLTGFGIGLTGCSEESSVKDQTKVTTPGGTSTVTDQTTVKQSGKNPPPPQGP